MIKAGDRIDWSAVTGHVRNPGMSGNFRRGLRAQCSRMVLVVGCLVCSALFVVKADGQMSPGPQTTPALLQKAPDAAALSRELASQGNIPIIVEFAFQGTPIDAGKPEQLQIRKKEIRTVQESIINAHFGSVTDPRPGDTFARALQLFDLTPMFAVRVNRAELDALAADPRVVRIHANGLSRPS